MLPFKTILLIALLLPPFTSRCQHPDTVSFRLLNSERIHTNLTGMKVLGAWGAVNLVSGAAGYLAADDRKWKSFHAMNALWGAVNGGITVAGYMGGRREARQAYSAADALHRYEATKRLFLLNAGLDGLYIASGIYLREHADQAQKSPEVWRGFGNSVLLQGAGLLLFDSFMFAAHQHRDKKWYRLLQGVQVSGNGVGVRYTF